MYCTCENDGTSPLIEQADNYMRIFSTFLQTSTPKTWDGASVDRASADGFCQAAQAEIAGLECTSPSFAFMSGTSPSALRGTIYVEDFSTAWPWYGPNGQLWAKGFNWLIVDEVEDTLFNVGATSAAGDRFWTGTDPPNAVKGDTCTDWTTTAGVGATALGSSAGTWFFDTDSSCSDSYGILCACAHVEADA